MGAFELWYWRRFLRVCWTARKSNQSILKEINPEYSLERLMLKLNCQYFGHLIFLLLLLIFNFIFIFKLDIIVLVLPNIKMNPPQVYMCSPSWTLLPPHTIPLGHPRPPDFKNWLIRKDPDAGKDWGQEKGKTEGATVGWHHWLNGHEFQQAPGDGEGQGSLVCCSPWGRKESDMTEQLNWGGLNKIMSSEYLADSGITKW